MKWFVDGFTYRSNPSEIGGGFTIFDDTKLVLRKEILKPHFTSNEAELLGVLECAKLASKNDEINTDSRNTLAWVKSGKPKARPDLAPQAMEAKDLIKFKELKVIWIARADNWAGIHNDNNPIPFL